MTNELKDFFKRYRRKGIVASESIKRARAAMNEGSNNPWNIPTPKHIEYNSQCESGGRWVENVSQGLRFVGYADQIAERGITHKGWFINEFQDEVYRGVVYRLPHSKGFAYGYADPCNEDCAYLVFDTQYANDERGAAYAADRIAEKHAEQEREYQEAFLAGNEYSEAGVSVKRGAQSVLELIRDMKVQRAKGATPAICNALKGVIKDSLREIAKLRRKRHQLVDDFSATWRKDVWPAFNDGAGEAVLK